MHWLFRTAADAKYRTSAAIKPSTPILAALICVHQWGTNRSRAKPRVQFVFVEQVNGQNANRTEMRTLLAYKLKRVQELGGSTRLRRSVGLTHLRKSEC